VAKYSVASRGGSDFKLEDNPDEVVPIPTREGYQFLGWKDANGNGVSVNSIYDNAAFKAQWEIINYEISYALDNGSVTSANPTVFNYETETFTINNPSKTGYTFTGWSGTGITDKTTTLTIPKNSIGNREYKANYSINSYKLMLDATGGNTSVNSKTIVYNEVYGELPVPTRTGYVFTGWYTKASGGTEVTTQTKMEAADVTIYAQWKDVEAPKISGTYTTTISKEGTYYISVRDAFGNVDTEKKVFYKLTLQSSVGEGLPTNSIIVMSSPEVSLPNIGMVGYTFNGWTNMTSGATGLTKIRVTGNATLKISFTLNTCTVALDANGGSVSTSSMVFTYGSTYSGLPTPARDGYIFTGWYSATSGGTKYDSSTVVSTTGNITLYAQWGTMATLGSGTPAKAWDGDASNFAEVGGNSATLHNWNVDDWDEGDYTKFSYQMSYSFSSPKRISGVTITVPSQSAIVGKTTHAMMYYRKFYDVKASIHVDGVLCGEVNVKHNTSKTSFDCIFATPVNGTSVNVVFNRNTYASKGGQYYGEPYDANLYIAGYYAAVNEITVHCE
jgi:uncharacterized repeat protein (TIGR02543 family)